MRFYFFGPRIGGRWGFRPGVSFSPSDFIQKEQSARTSPIEGSFVYVIEDAHGRVKVGTSKDPLARMATLRTGSASPLKFSYIGVTPSEGYEIEHATHKLLRGHNIGGEWFDVPPEMAVGALAASASKLGYPLAQLTEDQTARTLQIARNGGMVAPSVASEKTVGKFLGGVLMWSLLSAAVFVTMINTNFPTFTIETVSAGLLIAIAVWAFRYSYND